MAAESRSSARNRSGWIYRLLAPLLLVAAASFVGETSAANAAECPNEAIREAQVSETFPEGTVSLPNCMALELVSPPKKYNQYAIAPNFSASGDRVRYFSLAALAETPSQAYIYDPYTATRADSGWQSTALTMPPTYDVGPSGYGYPCAYSADLSRWVYWGSTPEEAGAGITTPFKDSLSGPFEPLGPTLVARSGNMSFKPVRSGYCEGVSPELDHFFFSIPYEVSYLPGDPIPPYTIGNNVYEAYLANGVPTVVLLQRDTDGVVHGGACGAQVGAGIGTHSYKRGAISSGAERVYLTTRPAVTDVSSCNPGADQRIMVRRRTAAGIEIEELIPNECTRVSPPCSTATGSDFYLGASQEGTRVYFTTARQLANSDKDLTIDLYLYDGTRPMGERLTQVTAGDDTAITPGEGAEYLGLPDFSGDGSHAYFLAEDVLTTTQNEAGQSAQAGQPNLYLYQRDANYPDGRTVFIATLAAGDAATWSNAPGQTNEAIAVPLLGSDKEDQAIGGNGHRLLFFTRAGLDPTDTDGKADIYRYDAEIGSLLRVSKAEPGGSDNGPQEPHQILPYIFSGAGPHDSSFSRWASEDGESVVFTTSEALDPEDKDSLLNAYLWRNGDLAPLPSSSVGVGLEPTISLSGNSVAFVYGDPLLPEDGDGAKDVYVVRANGGFPIPNPAPPCSGETCQGAPDERPAPQPSPSGSATAGNVKPQGAACAKGKVYTHGHCAKRKSPRCGKKKSDKRRRCVKHPHPRHSAKDHDRGGHR